MRINAFSTLAFGLGFGLVGAQLVACGNSAEDCNATATCGSGAGSSGAGSAGKSGGGSGSEGGGDGAGTNSGGSQGTSGTSGGGGEGGGAGSGCTGDVADDAACWTTNELGVFVSSDTGDDAAGDGTREKPFASISHGIASAAGKNVYVCLGAADEYAEKLTITDTVGDGVHIYGGFECDNWTHDVARYVTVASPEPIALRIQSLKTGVQIENVRFFAANGVGADESSYGAYITQSKGVVLRRVEITAGDGLKGADGEAGVKGANGSTAGAAPVGSDGCEAVVKAGSWELVMSSCGSQGGTGGLGQKSGANGNPGSAGIPTDDVTGEINNAGPGETVSLTALNGKVGAAGNAGDRGSAADASGVLSQNGFTPAPGKAGTDGFPGQGGGGGGASIGTAACFGASGGAGGMGGCGGTPGKGGKGGGVSIGLFSWNSDITLDSCAISSGIGGAGGAGGKAGGGGSGASGGSGGADDAASTTARGGDGGPGGPGGNGGSGSGGTGGPSYAIAYFGTKPAYEAADTTLTAGAGGDPGIGGELLTKAPDGSEGDSAEVFQVP